MPNSQQLYGELQGLQGQMQGLTGQMQQYTPVQSQDIYNELLNRVDNFKPLYEAQRGFETQAYAEPAKAMADYYGQYGQDPSQGRSAMTQLQGILQNVGRLYGSADTMNDVINQRGGQLQQLAGTTLDQYNSARANLQDQIAQTQNLYNNKQGMYNTALQLEEQAKQRAEAERARQAQIKAQRDAQLRAEADARRQANEQKIWDTPATNGEIRKGADGVEKVYDAATDAWVSRNAWQQKQAQLGTKPTPNYLSFAPAAQALSPQGIGQTFNDIGQVYNRGREIAQQNNTNWYDYLNPAKAAQNVGKLFGF